ncbi:7,8-didemethyl-8-hydroxy-5-deazariboflavin synthase CofG [Microbacterium allomyrinae]|uniref:7,8-didemethyl-8-hydroxy-5-deazariboflavin synthase n=1 Tax=Microbacterium allomyrinae TaxID=2830666 RepID=A0A9X1LTH3_9MICO|nr:7,8-didemethyl-8-hydroxy-5-deazariboflavin synthase CofG [Microbacterium allomyrinae]MCC2031744.1 7,8-didemethyl-8-hydroxy-5-deazariboflavin synthase CofG [Microbacterium allomyrinae]
MTVVASSIAESPARAAAAAVDRALARAHSGERLDVADAEALLSATGERLERLLRIAGAMRDAGLAASGRPGVLTYSRKVFVPLTTLCRDRCHYCVFVDTPGQLLKKRKPAFMSPEQVLAVVRQGQAMDCKEVLLTLGDRPEDRWPEARAWLDEHGFASTLDYVGHIARLVTAETGLLAHLNPGVMSADELRTLRPTAPSMGMMLETTSRRLFDEPGQVHFGSPDKDPDVRLAVIDDAGRARVPFTTGILVGIGETLRDRAESLVAIRDAHERHMIDGPGGAQGHVQEVIVQNFRAKPRTAMQGAPDAELLEYVAAVAVARLVMGPRMRIQVPPNLSDPAEFDLLVRAGADDWGGVSPLTADHVNPERPWPHLDDLAGMTSELGFELRERLTAQPEFVLDAETWIDAGLRPAVAALADAATGLAASVPATVKAAGPSARSGHDDADTAHLGPALSRDGVEDSGDAPADASADARQRPNLLNSRRGHGVKELAEAAASDPLALDDTEWATLLEATGGDLDALAATADDVRRYTVGEAVSLVVNRNLTSSGLRPEPTADPATFTLDDVAAITADAWDLGATELCVQGLLPPDADPVGYLDIARAVKAAAPRIHLHAYRPQDVRDLAERGGLGLAGALAALRDAGVDTVPGTGVKVLSERVRALIAPGDLEIDRWIEGVAAAHRAGFSSTSVLFYGHVETAAERVAHLRRLRRMQGASTSPAGGHGSATGTGGHGSATGTGGHGSATGTGGFTEFVPIPLPGPAGGVPLVVGRAAIDEHRAMVAVSRLLLSGSIPHIQIPWTRVGREASAVLLQSGGDDLGGTLLDGRVKPAAGIEQGLELPVADAAALVARLFRPFRQRTTDYREPPADRKALQR